ncbi:stage II sporulation protein M [Massilibacterium senegalense]|uniref:stage II sporulation protein M n=1 Tax=Massilibacterium senegalense TaxID=1632858 RepID=UPI000784C2E8|nr:stage II sporulation protein M [Massilibacterium senegalense]
MNGRFSNWVQLHIKTYSSLYVFTIILFVMGVMFGAIIVNSLTFEQKKDLYGYLTRFFGQVSDGQLVSAQDIWIQGIIHYSKYIGLIWLLGLSVIGLPILLILLFLKGVMIGFTVGFLVNQMGLYGFFLSFASIIPQNILLIPTIILITTMALSFSLTLIKQQLGKSRFLFGPLFFRYSLYLLLSFFFIVVASFLEAYLSPLLMKMIINYK